MPNIFISYRREDSAASARDLHRRLVGAFPRDEVFLDISTIPFGADFAGLIERKLDTCQVMLVVIGRQWATVRSGGQQRLAHGDDLVRREVLGGFARDMRMIPVLVDGAVMPAATDMPEALRQLVGLHAVEVSHSRADYDVGRLINDLGGSGAADAATTSGSDFWGQLAGTLATKLGERLAARAVPDAAPPVLPYVPAARPAALAPQGTALDLSGGWLTTNGVRHDFTQSGLCVASVALNAFGMPLIRGQGTLQGLQLQMVYEASYQPPYVVRGQVQALVSADGRIIQGTAFDPAVGNQRLEMRRL